MRGRRDQQTTMLAFVDLEERVPRKHPLRVVKQFADRALRELSPVFDRMYAAGGRPSIPPERLLKASLLIALYSIRSETAFCEELDYQLLYRWFLDMGLLEPSFDPTVFTKNRRRLLKHDVAQRFFDEVVRQAAGLGLLSDQHFTVDGTLIEAPRVSRATAPRTSRRQIRRPTILAIRRSTSMASAARTRRIRARRTPRRCWPRRARAKRPVCRSWATP
jgi:transposase